MAKVFLADRTRQLIQDLENNGFDSYTFKTSALMNELMELDVAKKNPIVAYYLAVYARKNGKPLTGIFNVGDEIAIRHDIMGQMPFVVIGKDVDGSGSVTLLAKEVLAMMCYDAKETLNKSETWRQQYGNNRYKYSNIHQYLNTLKGAGRWFSAAHGTDGAPTFENIDFTGFDTGNIDSKASEHVMKLQYMYEHGFLANLDTEFVGILKTVSKTAVVNSADASSLSESVNGKVFLLSKDEIGAGSKAATYPYFTDSNSRIAKASRHLRIQARGVISSQNSGSGGTYEKISNGGVENWAYWLRDASNTSSASVEIISQDGNIGFEKAYAANASIGVRPTMVI
nr:MAG TPA: hypothetical protein [Caudoviricetes sp.]